MLKTGTTIWLTGMSGAGKSTIAQALAEQLRKLDLPVEILDGDEVRQYLSPNLGYTREDRDINVRRIAFVAGMLAKHGVFVITAAISPYAEGRGEARQLSPNFIEVFVNAPLETLVRRDPKGLYEKALSGEIPHFTGVSDPYEAPVAPEIEIRTDQLSIDETVDRIMTYLQRQTLIPTIALTGDTVLA